jgi:hypothetical protein
MINVFESKRVGTSLWRSWIWSRRESKQKFSAVPELGVTSYGARSSVNIGLLTELTRYVRLDKSKHKLTSIDVSTQTVCKRDFACFYFRQKQNSSEDSRRTEGELHKQEADPEFWSIKQQKATLLSNQAWQAKRSRFMKHLTRQCDEQFRTDKGSRQNIWNR